MIIAIFRVARYPTAPHVGTILLPKSHTRLKFLFVVDFPCS